MQSIEQQINQFILERIPYFAYEKFYMAYFLGKSETPPSVWINTVIEDWAYFRNNTLKPTDFSPLAKKMDHLCSLLEAFLLNFGQSKELNHATTFQKSDWIHIVHIAKNIFQ